MGQAPTRPTRRKVTPATGHPLLSPDAAARVDARRMEHHRRLQEHRPESAGNWHCMWPLGTQQAAISAYVASLLQGLPIVEPFLGGAAYRVACRLPSDVTVGGDAFHAAFRDVIGVLGWLPTSGHGVPHLRGRLGVGVRRTIRRTRKLRDGAAQHLLALRGRTLPHQGAWAPPSRQESAQGIRQLLTQDEVDGLLHALQPVFASGSHPVDMLDALPWRARVRAASLAAFL